jgi:hypothetical protein
MVKVKDHRKVFMEGCWLWLPMRWLRYLDTSFYIDSTNSSFRGSDLHDFIGFVL